MIKFITKVPFSFAAYTIITINAAVIIFHFLVLTQVIPFEVVWAGRLKSLEEMYVFETISIVINIILIFIVLTKMKRNASGDRATLINIVLWLFVVVFTLNTVGNLTAATTLETYIATPLTFILAVLCWRVAIE
jgi:hypothetical protein